MKQGEVKVIPTTMSNNLSAYPNPIKSIDSNPEPHSYIWETKRIRRVDAQLGPNDFGVLLYRIGMSQARRPSAGNAWLSSSPRPWQGNNKYQYSVIYKSASTEVATESLRAKRVAFNKVFGVTAGFPSSSCFALQILLVCKYFGYFGHDRNTGGAVLCLQLVWWHVFIWHVDAYCIMLCLIRLSQVYQIPCLSQGVLLWCQLCLLLFLLVLPSNMRRRSQKYQTSGKSGTCLNDWNRIARSRHKLATERHKCQK